MSVNVVSSGAVSYTHLIGADGLVLITKEAGLFTMRIFNADGSEAEMCGNAVRCMAHYLLDQALAEGPAPVSYTHLVWERVRALRKKETA